MVKRNVKKNRFRTVVGIQINYLTLLTLFWGAEGRNYFRPQHDDYLTLTRMSNECFITEIDNIRHEIPI